MLQPIILLIVLIFINAVFKGAEAAILSAPMSKLEDLSDDGSKKAKRILKLQDSSAKFILAVQIITTASVLLQGAVLIKSFALPLTAWLKSLSLGLSQNIIKAISIAVVMLIWVSVSLLFQELIPKRIAVKNAEELSFNLSGLMLFIFKILSPILWLLKLSANLFLRLFGLKPNEFDDPVTEEEILMMLKEGGEQGTILEAENEIIQNVFEFNDIIAKDIYTHRVNVDILWLEDDNSVWEDTIHSTRHTRYPVCDESADNVVGILNVRDYFRLENRDRETILKEALSPAYFVPETIKADVLFRNMKATHNSLAVIIDERGGMEGIITMYDLIEELVGELNEEADTSEPTVTKIGENSWKIQGNISLEDLAEKTGLEFPDDEYDTLTGLVFDELGIIPSDGTTDVKVTLPEATVSVTKVLAHQIEEAIITMGCC